jgi:hypothetical protein
VKLTLSLGGFEDLKSPVHLPHRVRWVLNPSDPVGNGYLEDYCATVGDAGTPIYDQLMKEKSCPST